MNFSRMIFTFFIVFFSLQLILGKAGLISFIQQRKSTNVFYENVNHLIEINEHLANQVELSKSNTSYLLMNAHRVGLLGEGEYLIKLDQEFYFPKHIYSPGTLILEKSVFYLSNMILFLISLLMIGVYTAIQVMYVYITQERNANKSIDSDIQNDTQNVSTEYEEPPVPIEQESLHTLHS